MRTCGLYCRHRPLRAPAILRGFQHCQIIHRVAEDHVLLRADPEGITEFFHGTSLVDAALIKIHKHQACRCHRKDFLKGIQIRIIVMGIRSVRINDAELGQRHAQRLHIVDPFDLNTDPSDHIQICGIRALCVGLCPGINVPGLIPASGKVQSEGNLLGTADGNRLKGFLTLHDYTSVGAEIGQLPAKFREQIPQTRIGPSARKHDPHPQIQEPSDHPGHLGRRHRHRFRQKRSVNIRHYHSDHAVFSISPDSFSQAAFCHHSSSPAS